MGMKGIQNFIENRFIKKKPQRNFFIITVIVKG